jgi:hypothetical protein
MLITSNTINELKISRLPQTKSSLQQMKTIILILNRFFFVKSRPFISQINSDAHDEEGNE